MRHSWLALSMLPAAALACLAGGTTTGGGDTGGRRVALIVGNSDYQHVSTLRNPRNDAEALAASFERLGFDVFRGTDMTKAEMDALIDGFAVACSGARLGLVYYAGHGMAVDKENYLIPVDFDMKTGETLEARLVPLNELMSQLRGQAASTIYLLDACRDNPFAQVLSEGLTQGRNISVDGRSFAAVVGQGLAKVEPPGEGYVGFATEEGTVASDGSGEHSPFTEGLLANIERPGLEFKQMMTDVRGYVKAITEGKQNPIGEDRMSRQVFFRSKRHSLPPP